MDYKLVFVECIPDKLEHYREKFEETVNEFIKQGYTPLDTISIKINQKTGLMEIDQGLIRTEA